MAMYELGGDAEAMRSGLEEAGAAKAMFAEGGVSSTNTDQLAAERAALEKAAEDMDRVSEGTPEQTPSTSDIRTIDRNTREGGRDGGTSEGGGASKPTKIVAL